MKSKIQDMRGRLDEISRRLDAMEEYLDKQETPPEPVEDPTLPKPGELAQFRQACSRRWITAIFNGPSGLAAFPFIDDSGRSWETLRRPRGIWLLWFGGECPVEPGVTVVYLLRGDRSTDKAKTGEGTLLDWQWDGSVADIIAFMIRED